MTETPKERQRAKNRKLFTEANVLTLRLKRKQYMVWDGSAGRGSGDVARGLGILVSPTGTKSYRSTFYFPGSPKSHSRHLGRVGEISLEKARTLCRQDRADARNGIDPRAKDPATSDKYKGAVEEYIKREQIGRHQNISAKAAERILLKDCEDWWERPVATIRPQGIQARLELICNGDPDRDLKPRPYLANLFYARMRTFFNWCAKPTVGKLQLSPMLGIDKPSKSAKRREREWFKDAAGDQAIKTLWAVADKLDKVEGQYLKCLLLTGKRKSALAEMCWEELEPDWFWNAPQTNIKNKRLHSVPLPSLVQRVLHPRQQSGYVFPGRRDGRIEVDGRLQKKIIEAGAMSDFFFHGVRHLAETKLAKLKIPAHIRDMLFDHVPDRGSG